MFPFEPPSPRKHQKAKAFLVFSGEIKREHLEEKGYEITKLGCGRETHLFCDGN